jgi:hypothetical protein
MGLYLVGFATQPLRAGPKCEQHEEDDRVERRAVREEQKKQGKSDDWCDGKHE